MKIASDFTPCIQLVDGKFYEPRQYWMDVIELINKMVWRVKKKDLEDGVHCQVSHQTNIALVRSTAVVGVDV
jgi:hypothetical protein